MNEKTCFIEKVGVNGYHLYSRSKKVMMVAGRDFVLDYIVNQESDGTVIIVQSSNPDLDHLVDPPKGTVRGISPLGGYIITPNPEDKSKSYVKLLVELNFGGNIPEFAIKTAFRD